MRLAFLAALLFAQDSPVDRLVLALGDSDPAVREEATKSLRELGVRAETALQRPHSDVEIRLRAKDLLLQIEHDLEQQAREKEARPGRIKFFAAEQKHLAPGVAVTDGARFTVKRLDWKSKGTVFETEVESFLAGDLEWDISGIAAAAPLKVETCAVHSPKKVYVDGASAAPKVTIKGLRRWYCDVPIELKEPREGDRTRVGPFEIVLSWPNLILKSDRPVPANVLEKALSIYDVTLKPRPGVSTFRFGVRSGVLRGQGGGNEDRAWCGCIGAPSQEPKPFRPVSVVRTIVAGNGAETCSLDEIESISILFHKPVEEAFEMTSTPLR